MTSILSVTAVVLVIVALVWAEMKLRSEAFKRRFPPMSDREFLARCTPGTDPKVALRVRRLVAYHLGVDYECIYPSSRFAQDLGFD